MVETELVIKISDFSLSNNLLEIYIHNVDIIENFNAERIPTFLD